MEQQPYENIGFFWGAMVDTLRDVVGAKIRALRKGLSMSQADLAEAIGCDPQLVGCYERGKYLPGIEQLIRIATVFDVAPGELLPGGQDVLRTRLISLRQEVADLAMKVDSPDSLEKILVNIRSYIIEENGTKKNN